jgi:hypothetical protein
MSTIIYNQGLQSCLIHHEQKTHHQFQFKFSDIQEKCKSQKTNSDNSHYSFLQNICPDLKTKDEEEHDTIKPYVHPSMAIKRSLSEKSLEICTENLGSENGSDDHHVFDEIIFSNSNFEQQPRVAVNKKLTRSVTDFPPPLTTISGSSPLGSIFVRSHREDGRLIVEAVKVPSPRPSVFKAERSEGRLRLCFNEDDTWTNGEDGDEHVCSDVVEEGGEIEGQDGNYMEVERQIGQCYHQRSLINSNSRCKEVGECESTRNNLLRWGVAISIS